MQCDDVAELLPAAVDGTVPRSTPSVQRHIESCLRCQAELARYRRMLRGLQLLRTRYLEPAPGLLAQTLAAIEPRRRAQAVRSILSGRRLATPVRHRRRRGRGRCRHRRGDRRTAPAAALVAGYDAHGRHAAGTRVSPHQRRRRLGSPATRCYPFGRPDRARRAVAQLVEHRSPKPAVGGSSPSCPAREPTTRPRAPAKDGCAVSMNRQTSA